MRFWLESGKNMQEHVHFLYLFQIFCRCSLLLFFSQGRDQLLGEGGGGGWGQRNIGPHISPLHGFWTAGLESSN